MRTFTITVKSKDSELAALTATVEAESAFKAVAVAVEGWSQDNPLVWAYSWGIAKWPSAGDPTNALVICPSRA